MATIEPRESKDGKKSYRVRIRLSGEKPRTRTFKRLTDAKIWAGKAESDLQHGAYVPLTADRRRTLAEMIDRYQLEYLPARKLADESKHRALLAWWHLNYGHVTQDRLKPEVIAGARSVLLQTKNKRFDGTLSGPTVNRYLAALSAVCKWAWKEARILPANPVLAVTKSPENDGLIRYLTPQEYKAVVVAMQESEDPNVYCAVMLALTTGARLSNLRWLTWDDVDMVDWRIRLAKVKNKQPRYTPVVGAGQAALKAQYDADPTKTGWVFKGGKEAVPRHIDSSWRKVRKAAGVEDVKFHALRHTTGSYLTMNGATLAEVADALNQKTLTMAKRYSHQSGEHIRGTLERMSDSFLEIDLKTTRKANRSRPKTNPRRPPK